ncbi:MAG TPA: carbohydrate kinase family protein [Anaerolineaceae bacterium]|jgi:ribokinase
MSAGDLVLLVGDINTDVVLHLEEGFPPPGGDSLVRDAYIGPGGGMANTACVLAKLGLHPRLIARVGTDVFAEAALNAYREAGVDLSAIERDPRLRTGLIFIPVLPGGERTMFSYRGANSELRLAGLDRDAFRDVKYLQLSGYDFLISPQREATWKAVHLARELEIPIALDLTLDAVRYAPADIRRLAGLLDVCVLGIEDGAAYIGTDDPATIAHSLLEQGVRLAAVKLGARGAYLADRHSGVEIPAFRVGAVDTTGAGDAFNAGVVFGRINRMDPLSTGILAVALGALATTVSGAGPGLPGKSEAIALLERSISEVQPLEFALRETLAALRA